MFLLLYNSVSEKKIKNCALKYAKRLVMDDLVFHKFLGLVSEVTATC